MATTIVGTFATRRDAELAVEHLVQEHGIEPAEISIQPAGEANSAGINAAGADVESGHPGVEKRGNPELGGPIEVLVHCNEVSEHKVDEILKEVSAKHVRSL